EHGTGTHKHLDILHVDKVYGGSRTIDFFTVQFLFVAHVLSPAIKPANVYNQGYLDEHWKLKLGGLIINGFPAFLKQFNIETIEKFLKQPTHDRFVYISRGSFMQAHTATSTLILQSHRSAVKKTLVRYENRSGFTLSNRRNVLVLIPGDAVHCFGTTEL